MKPRLRDYLIILFALVVIFLCGSGVGYLVGEKKGRAQSTTRSAPPAPETDTWSERTMTRLTRSLDLTAAQRTQVQEDVERAGQKIQASRNQAIGDYYRHLLQLHDDLLPHLKPAQQKKIKKDREKLQRILDSRF